MPVNTKQSPQQSAGRRTLRRVLAVAGLIALTTVVAGCAGKNKDDLIAYVKSVKARKAGHIAPLPEFKSYEVYAYKPDGLRDPFKPSEKATIHAGAGKGGPRPDQHRNKEPLEAFPLDGLKYVGLLQKGKTTWAIVTAPDGFVYQVQVGNYMGQNYGRVTKITAGEIDIRELVPSGVGGWVERKAVLALTE